MSYNQSVDASAMVANDTLGLLSLSNEILNQIIANFDLTPASEDATTAICLALTSRRLYTIVLDVSISRNLKSLCPRPKNWWFLPSDYKPEVQNRLMRHWTEATRVKWRKAVPYLRLITELQDGSMEVMERQGYVFDSGKAVWMRPVKSAAIRRIEKGDEKVSRYANHPLTWIN